MAAPRSLANTLKSVPPFLVRAAATAARLGLGLILPAMAVSSPSQAAWKSFPVTHTAPEAYPRAISDGAGGAIVAWIDYTNPSWRLYVQRALSTGNADPAWPANGLVVASPAYDFAIAGDGSQGVIVTVVLNGTDIRASHVQSTGTTGIYFVRLMTPAGIRTSRFARIR